MDSCQQWREHRLKVKVLRLERRVSSWVGVGRVLAAPSEGVGKSKREETISEAGSFDSGWI